MAIIYMNNQQSTINSAFVGRDKIVAIYYNNQLLYNFSGIDTISYLLDSFIGFSGNPRMKAFKIRKVSSFENIKKEISDSSKSKYKTYLFVSNNIGYIDTNAKKIECGLKLSSLFKSCSYLNNNISDILNNEIFNFSKVEDISNIFYSCNNLTGSPICFSNISNFDNAYFNCRKLKGNPVCEDKVINMRETYRNCKNLTGSPVCGPNVTNMSNTFDN